MHSASPSPCDPLQEAHFTVVPQSKLAVQAGPHYLVGDEDKDEKDNDKEDYKREEGGKEEEREEKQEEEGEEGGPRAERGSREGVSRHTGIYM